MKAKAQLALSSKIFSYLCTIQGLLGIDRVDDLNVSMQGVVESSL
jgi:hypothetical protein